MFYTSLEKCWKAQCLFFSTVALGISTGLVGPFIYHASMNFDYVTPGHLACLFAARGFGSFIGTLVAMYALVKSNQSLWITISLLVLAAFTALIPWSNGSIIILTSLIVGQGMAAAVVKMCIQNLSKFYHDLAPFGIPVQRIMHIGFAIGCFMALLNMVMFTNVSSYEHPFLPKNGHDFSDQTTVAYSITMVKKLVKREVNSVSSSDLNINNFTVPISLSPSSPLLQPSSLSTQSSVSVSSISTTRSSPALNPVDPLSESMQMSSSTRSVSTIKSLTLPNMMNLPSFEAPNLDTSVIQSATNVSDTVIQSATNISDTVTQSATNISDTVTQSATNIFDTVIQSATNISDTVIKSATNISDTVTQGNLTNGNISKPTNNSNTVNTSLSVNSTVSSSPNINATLSLTSVPPMKPAVVDVNDLNHHKETADGQIINKELKIDIGKNPIDGKQGNGNVDKSTTTTTTTTTSTTTTTIAALNGTLSTNVSRVNGSKSLLNATSVIISSVNITSRSPLLTTKSHLSGSKLLDEPVTSTASNPSLSHNSSASNSTFSSSTTNTVASNNTITTNLSNSHKTVATTSTTVLSTTTTHKAVVDMLASPTSSLSSSPLSSSSSSSNITFKDSPTSSAIIQSTLSSTTLPHILTQTSTSKIISSLSSTNITTKSTTFPTRNSDDGFFNIKPKHLIITQLDTFENLINHLRWDTSRETGGFYCLALIICLISGMLAINSGLCLKVKNSRCFPEVSYTCSDKSPANSKTQLYARIAVIIFQCTYLSSEILISGLLASYLASLHRVTMYMGIVATCFFWFFFFIGRLCFFFLSPFAKQFRLTFLTIFLTLVCLLTFSSALHWSSLLPWYFFAYMLSFTAFFFSMISPSFSIYMENFPFLDYTLPIHEMVMNSGEMILPSLFCSFIFVGGKVHLLKALIILMAVCFLSVFSFKFFVTTLQKPKTARRKPSLTGETWSENGDDSEVLTSSFDVGSTTKPLLPP